MSPEAVTTGEFESLLRRARALLAAAASVSEAPGADFAPAGGRQYTSAPPTGDHESFHDRLLRSFQAASTPSELVEAIEQGERALERLRHGPATGKPETQAEREDRILNTMVGLADMEVAVLEHMHVRAVRQLRVRAGREPQYGRPAERQWASAGERRERAALMTSAGLSTRETARLLGVSHTTVQSDLRNVA